MTRRPITREKLQLLDRALALRPHSVPELAAIADLRGETVRRYLSGLFPEVHISTWVDGRTPMFKVGYGKDAKKPKPLTAAQRMAKSRANKDQS